MLKELHNEARFTLKITTLGPLLIRSGFPTLTGPDMTPVLTYRNNDWQVYLPGSSLKGVVRSHVEKICRTLHPEPPVVCNPFLKMRDTAKPDYSDVFCGDKFERRGKQGDLSTAQAYADSCPVCRLFGSTAFIGRVSIGDGYLDNDAPDPRPTELRDGVGIDRLTGGAFSRALFNLEAVSSGVEFYANVQVRNFEAWQLGMLLVAAQDMADGLVRIGSGRSRGMGGVKADIDSVTVSYIGRLADKPANEVWGLGRFLGAASPYGAFADDVLTVANAPAAKHRGIRSETVFAGDSLAALTAAAADAFVTRVQNWVAPEAMSYKALGLAAR